MQPSARLVSANAPRLIFVLGLMRRSGTNFLFHLLSRHPDVMVSSLHEDFLLHDAHLLVEYVRRTTQQWIRDWSSTDTPDALAQALGSGLQRFLAGRRGADWRENGSEKRILAKTPSIQNIEHAFDIFPNAALLILVRDGRDVVESGVRSFGWTYERAMRLWCAAARTLVEFERGSGKRNGRHRVVRYEDMVREPEAELRRILNFLELDPGVYDFTAAREAPVLGSSTFHGQRTGIHWNPVAKTEAFNPIGRWRTWDAYRRRRFALIAGALNSQLGYESDERDVGRLEALGHRLLQAASATREVLRSWNRLRLERERL